VRKGLGETDLLALFAGQHGQQLAGDSLLLDYSVASSRTRGYGPRDRMSGSGRNLCFSASVTRV